MKRDFRTINLISQYGIKFKKKKKNENDSCYIHYKEHKTYLITSSFYNEQNKQL